MSMRILGGQAAHGGPTRQEQIMTEQPTVTRRSSIYTIRLAVREQPHIDDRDLTRLARGLDAQQIGVADRGDSSVSFRSTDDATALTIAKAAAIGVQRGMTLTTGLGIHRREVTA